MMTLIESRVSRGEMAEGMAIGENNFSDIITMRMGRVMMEASHERLRVRTKMGRVTIIIWS